MALVLAIVLAVAAWRTAVPADPGPPADPVTSTTVVGEVTTTSVVVEAPIEDGEHFVFIKEVLDGKIVVDQAEMLSGEPARQAAIEDGVIGADEDLPNDFYIRNTEAETVTLDVAPDADPTVLVFDSGGSIVEEDIKLNELKVAFTGDYAGHTIYGLVAGEFPVTIVVDGGIVTDIVQVYLP